MSRSPFPLPARPAARIAALALALLAVPAAGAAAGCADVLFYEDFSSLGGWTVVDGGDPPGGHFGGRAPKWTTSNPGDRQPPGLAEPFAIVDSFYNQSNLMDEVLISPRLDASGLVCVALTFSHDFRWYPGFLDELAEVWVRSDLSAGEWVVVQTYTEGDARGIEILDLTAYAAANLRVAFRYSNANWEEYWAVDDVAVLGTSAQIFADGFESGSAGAWSAAAAP